MRDLSLHLLDLVQNSISAGATLITIDLALDEAARRLTITLEDNGCGMDADMLARAQGPFGTTRTTRKVGMGIPLFKENAERTGGSLAMESRPGQGTKLRAVFCCDSIDMKPMGDMAGTVAALVTANPKQPDFVFSCRTSRGESCLDTREIKRVLQGVSLDEPEVAAWLRQLLKEETDQLFGGMLQ